MDRIQAEIQNLVCRAGLSKDEIRIFESRIVGRKVTESLVHEAQHLIISLVKARSDRYEVPPQFIESLNQRFERDEIERRIMGNWEDPVSEKKSIARKLTSSNAYHSISDEGGRCPNCYKNGEQRFLGTMVIDGAERPTYHCTGCNKAYSELPSAINVLADEAVRGGAEKVGFIHAQAGGSGGSGIPVPQAQPDYRTIQQLDQVNSNLNTLNYTIQNLMDQVRNLAEQNNKLMEQLANDPLIHMRKSITEFDLK